MREKEYIISFWKIEVKLVINDKYWKTNYNCRWYISEEYIESLESLEDIPKMSFKINWNNDINSFYTNYHYRWRVKSYFCTSKGRKRLLINSAKKLLKDEDESIAIATLINRIEQWYYQTRKIDLSIDIYNLKTDGFKCDNLFEFLTHYELVKNSDLNYPVIINNEWQVIDGRHRICKAILKWDKKIKAIQILDSTVI